MNFRGNFDTIGTVDISAVENRLQQLQEQHWSADEFRQKRYEVHRDTQSIALVFDVDFRHTHPTRLPTLQLFEQDLGPILAMIADHYENSSNGQQLTRKYGQGYFVRTSLVNLIPGGVIAPHKDNNFSLSHSHRVHVPVTTNDHVEFTVGNETIVMRPGDIIEINNRREHSVSNKGKDHRVHLILDFVLPGEKCCCGIKHHPHTMCSPSACRETDHFRVACTCFTE